MKRTKSQSQSSIVAGLSISSPFHSAGGYKRIPGERDIQTEKRHVCFSLSHEGTAVPIGPLWHMVPIPTGGTANQLCRMLIFLMLNSSGHVTFRDLCGLKSVNSFHFILFFPISLFCSRCTVTQVHHPGELRRVETLC